jgi:hypothetical protein
MIVTYAVVFVELSSTSLEIEAAWEWLDITLMQHGWPHEVAVIVVVAVVVVVALFVVVVVRAVVVGVVVAIVATIMSSSWRR